jgi:hypothetical protein
MTRPSDAAIPPLWAIVLQIACYCLARAGLFFAFAASGVRKEKRSGP